MRILCVTNMYPSPDDPRSGTYVEQQVEGLRSIGLDVQVLVIPRSTGGMRQYLRVPTLVSGEFDRVRPAVVHVMYGGMLACRAVDISRKGPVVVSFGGSDLLGTSVGSPLLRLRAMIGVLCSHRAVRRAHMFIVKSQQLKVMLTSRVPGDRVAVIPNGVNLERFRPLDRQACRKELGWSPQVFHVLFCTSERTDPGKRLPLARAAVERLNSLGVSAELHVMTRVSHDRVPIWLNAADCLLMTSTHEGSPNIVKEALACNRPVVSTDVGDVRERFEGVEGCHLVEATPEAVAEGLRRVSSGPREIRGREKMRSLSTENVARRLVDVYRRAIAIHGGRE